MSSPCQLTPRTRIVPGVNPSIRFWARRTNLCAKVNHALVSAWFRLVSDKGVRFIAEQVSHHPPVSVAHCEGTGWELTITGRWKNKFWGRSMEIHPLGQTHIVFKDGEEVRFNQVTSCIHNILSGEKYVEFYGESRQTQCEADKSNLRRMHCQVNSRINGSVHLSTRWLDVGLEK